MGSATTAADGRRPLFDRRAPAALIAVCVTLVVITAAFRTAVGYLNIYLKKEPVELREHFDNISSTVGPWRAVGGNERLTDEAVEELGTSLYLNREYALDGNPRSERISMHLAYYTGMIDAVPHVPDRCLAVAGFNTRERARNYPMEVDRRGWTTDTRVNRATGRPYQIATYRDVVGRRVPVRMPVGDFELRTTEFSHPEAPDTRIYGGYFFIANGRVASTPEQVKLLAFRKSEEYAYYCKVQVLVTSRDGLTPEEFVSRTGRFIGALLPELMRCLPDWTEYEGRATTDSADESSSLNPSIP